VLQVFLESAMMQHRDDYLDIPVDTTAIVGDVLLALELLKSADETSGLVRLAVKTDIAQRPIYNFEVRMVALVGTDEGSKNNMTIQEFLDGPGVPLLYPFVREAVAGLTLRGRFGPVWLSLVNVASVRAQADIKEMEQKGDAATRKRSGRKASSTVKP